MSLWVRVARRIESDPLVLVAVTRRLDDPPRQRLAPVPHLGPLTDEVAGEVLDAVAPDLGPAGQAAVAGGAPPGIRWR
ncbi:hypothetical protein SBADM41S_04705 [Streptomyces badius]